MYLFNSNLIDEWPNFVNPILKTIPHKKNTGNYAHGKHELKFRYTTLRLMESSGQIVNANTYLARPCMTWVSTGAWWVVRCMIVIFLYFGWGVVWIWLYVSRGELLIFFMYPHSLPFIAAHLAVGVLQVSLTFAYRYVCNNLFYTM